MSDAPKPMSGAYNEHSNVQGSAFDLAAPVLDRALAAVPLTAQPMWLVDYGSATGRNSLLPMGRATAALRERGAKTMIVLHDDQPGNDFGALFEVLHRDRSRYTALPDVFAMATGRSFFEPVVPPDSVTLGWSSIAAHWLSKTPCEVPDHLWSEPSSAGVGGQFARQAAGDWARFVELRGRELEPGGQLVVVLAGTDEDGHSTTRTYLDLANEVARGLVRAEVFDETTYRRMTIPTYFRSPLELEAPFGQHHALQLCERISEPLGDPLWAAFERDGDPETLATNYVGWFRAFSEPTFRAAATTLPDPDAALETFYRAVHERVVSEPSLVRVDWRMHVLRARRRAP